MDYSSEYDRFINRIYRLNLALIGNSIIIISNSSILIYLLEELNFRILTILLSIVIFGLNFTIIKNKNCLLYTSPSPRD